MILNNCTTCGRKPVLKTNRIFHGEFTHCFWCNCGKCVYSEGAIWSAEVAADMWNRANPVEEEVKSDIINRIAHDLAVCAVKVDISTGKLKFTQSDNCGFSE